MKTSAIQKVSINLFTLFKSSLTRNARVSQVRSDDGKVGIVLGRPRLDHHGRLNIISRLFLQAVYLSIQTVSVNRSKSVAGGRPEIRFS